MLTPTNAVPKIRQRLAKITDNQRHSVNAIPVQNLWADLSPDGPGYFLPVLSDQRGYPTVVTGTETAKRTTTTYSSAQDGPQNHRLSWAKSNAGVPSVEICGTSHD